MSEFADNVREQAQRELDEEMFREQVEACKLELKKERARFARLRKFIALQRIAFSSLKPAT